MRYLGGKARIAKQLAAAMAPDIARCKRFVDAACGALNVTVEIAGVERLANDACAPLIALFEAWREGWRPPAVIDENLYSRQRVSGDCSSPLTAFLAFGCSYSGAWWNGWARPTKPRPKVPYGEVFADSAVRSLDRKLSRCVDVQFSALDFRQLDVSRQDVVYFDPEYKGTRSYDYFAEPFPYDEFIEHADELAKAGVAVYVSEYARHAESWEQVAEFTGNNKRSSTPGKGVERLFKVRPR